MYEPKHVARNTTNTSNKSSVVFDYIIFLFYTTYIGMQLHTHYLNMMQHKQAVM